MRYMLQILLLCWLPACATGEQVRLAVSKSVLQPLESLCKAYEEQTSNHCAITPASTGHLYAQAMHGNVFDILIGSNPSYTRGLINAGLVDSQDPSVIASSRIILWSAQEGQTPEALYNALVYDKNVPIVIPDPMIANYGLAVKSILHNLNISIGVQRRLIFANSIQQTYEFLKQNKNYIGFTNLAQLSESERQAKLFWEPDYKDYHNVIHDAVVFKNSSNAKLKEEFMNFLRSPESCVHFERKGYTCRNLSGSSA